MIFRKKIFERVFLFSQLGMPYPSRPCKVIDRFGLRQKAVSTNQIQVVIVSTGEIEGDVTETW